MNYITDIEKLIEKRYSTRNYTDQVVETTDELKAFASQFDTADYRFDILDYAFEEGVQVATYGMIKNAKRYIVAIGKKAKAYDTDFAMQFGYDFEQVILKATDMGLGTCWMAMSFKSDDITRLLNIQEDEQIVMASPFGYSDRVVGFQKLTRAMIKADKRKEPKLLFFDENFDTPLDLSEIGQYQSALEALRLAPSAGNSQPWRVVKNGETYDFYVQSKKFYENRKNQAIDLGYNDLGIGKLHFELVAKKYQLNGRFIQKGQSPIPGRKYAFSWVCE